MIAGIVIGAIVGTIVALAVIGVLIMAGTANLADRHRATPGREYPDSQDAFTRTDDAA